MITQGTPLSSPIASQGGDEYGRVVRLMPVDEPMGISLAEQVQEAGFGRLGHRTFSTEQRVGAVAAIRR